MSHRRGGRLSVLAVLGLVGLVVAGGCRSPEPTDVEVEVRNVGLDQNAGVPVVILQTLHGERVLPIWIGAAEAQAIAMEMQKVAPARPMTHDLVKRIMESTGVALRRVHITDLQQQTFFATIVLDQGGREIEVDSRPSDAIALALRFACPILVRRSLLESMDAATGGGIRDAATKIWGLTVQDLTPALAELLGVGADAGVVVSDVDVAERDGDGPRRGDVIVGVDGAVIRSVADLRAVAGAGREVRRLEVRRGTSRLVVPFAAARRATERGGRPPG